MNDVPSVRHPRAGGDPPPAAVATVILAAGASTRLGTPKQLVEYEGEPLVRRATRAALDAGAVPVFVVVGAHADLVVPALSGLAGVTVVPNDEWHAGLASSLAAGVRAAVRDGADAVLITLADQPLVDAAALQRLIAAFPGAHRVVASSYGDVLGVPAVFGAEHAGALLALTGDAGAGAWLRRHADDVTRVPLDAAALDVDTPADLARLHGEER